MCELCIRCSWPPPLLSRPPGCVWHRHCHILTKQQTPHVHTLFDRRTVLAPASSPVRRRPEHSPCSGPLGTRTPPARTPIAASVTRRWTSWGSPCESLSVNWPICASALDCAPVVTGGVAHCDVSGMGRQSSGKGRCPHKKMHWDTGAWYVLGQTSPPPDPPPPTRTNSEQGGAINLGTTCKLLPGPLWTDAQTPPPPPLPLNSGKAECTPPHTPPPHSPPHLLTQTCCALRVCM